VEFSFRIRKSFGESFDRETADYVESIAATKDENDPLVRLFGWDFFADGGLTAPVTIDAALRNVTLTLRTACAFSTTDGTAVTFDSIPDIRCEFGDVVFFEFSHDWGAAYWSEVTGDHRDPGLVYERCELDTLDELISIASERLGYPARSLLLRFDNDTVLGVVFGGFEMHVIQRGESHGHLEYFTKQRALEVVSRLRGKA